MSIINYLRTKKELKEKEFTDKLCNRYNDGDLEALIFLKNSNKCTPEQKQELTWLFKKNYELCEDPGYLHDEELYHEKLRNLLSTFNIKFINGDAYPAYNDAQKEENK